MRGIQQLTSSNLGAKFDLKAQLQVADATEKLLKDPQVAGVRDVKLRITTLRRRARIVYLPAYVVDYNFGSRFNAHGERTPERFQAVISGMGELLCCAALCYSLSCWLPVTKAVLWHAMPWFVQTGVCQ